MAQAITSVAQATTAGAYDAQNGSGAYKNASAIPTKAPTVSVNSAQPAVNRINTTIVPAITQAQTDLANHNNNVAISKAAVVPGSPQQGQPAPQQQSPQQTQPDSNSPQPGSPEHAIANDTDPGNKWVYDQNGNRVQTPLNQPNPQGYSDTKPNNPVVNGTGVVNSYTTDDGSKLQQYADGSYGAVDTNGKFLGTLSQQDFNSQIQNTDTFQKQQLDQQSASILSQLNQLNAGSYPLKPEQTAQVNGITQQFQNLIQQQATANANYTGGMTVAQNLYGMGTAPTGLGAIQGTITDGIQKIASLQSEQASAVGKMMSDFEDENYKELSDTYDKYTAASKTIQDHLDTVAATIQKTMEDNRNYQLQVKQQQDTEAQNKFDDTMKTETFNASQKKDAFDEMMQSANFTETQKKDNAEIYNQQVSQDIAKANLQISKDTYDATYGIFKDASGQPITATNIPGMTKQSNGTTVMDLSTFTDPKQQTAAANLARKTGAPVVTAAQAPAYHAWQSVNSLLNTIQTEADKGSARNSYKNDTGNLTAALKSLSSKDPAFATISTSGIGNGGLLDFSSSHTDQINALRDNLNSSLQAMIPGIPTPLFGQTFNSPADVQTWAQANGQTKIIDNLTKSYPNASAEDILKMINTGN